MVKTPKVRLYIRIRLPDGRDSFLDPVWNRNHTLRAAYALIDGHPRFHTEGSYYLRFLRDGKRVWQPVGQDAAIVALRNTEQILRAITLGRSTPAVKPELRDPVPSTTVSVFLEDAITADLYKGDFWQLETQP